MHNYDDTAETMNEDLIKKNDDKYHLIKGEPYGAI